MHYDFTAIPDAAIPCAVEAVFQHVVTTYASEAKKAVGVWRSVPDALQKYIALVEKRLPQLAQGTSDW
jgi:hypothetical protein